MKVPADKARTELTLPPADREAVPDELATLVTGVALGKPLHEVAALSTVRRTQRLLDRGEQLLAEVADDLVHATVAGDVAVVSEWREVDVELGDGGGKSRRAKVATKVGKCLTKAGARPSPHASKLDRALAANQHARAADARATAERVLTEYLDAQVQAIVAGDVWLRRGLDPIHSTRSVFDGSAAPCACSANSWTPRLERSSTPSCPGTPVCSVRCGTGRCNGSGSRRRWPTCRASW